MMSGLLRHLCHRYCAARATDLRRGEDGQTLLLGIGVIAVVTALLLVVAGATAVYLDLKTLTSLADSAPSMAWMRTATSRGSRPTARPGA